MMTTWKDLEQRARKLEIEAEKKIDELVKLDVKPSRSQDSAKEPLLGNKFEDVCYEVEALLTELSSINDQLNAVPKSDTVTHHAVQRHRELLCDCQEQFNKIRKKHQKWHEEKAREELFRTSGKSDIESYKPVLNRRMDLNLKENEHVKSSDRLINEQISIAMETRDHLNNQRHVMKRIRTTVNNVTNKFPIINSLLQRIYIKKKRDSLILAGVISFCTLLLLFYAFW